MSMIKYTFKKDWDIERHILLQVTVLTPVEKKKKAAVICKYIEAWLC